jgi:tRNA pseudouridine38-40 synthase
MPNLKLLLEYDGTRFHGWQRQPNRRTVQGVVQDTIRRISRERVNLIGAARTDAGVHALGQTAHFKTSSRMTEPNWRRALNSLLPDDVAVRAVETAPDDFHARYSARSKQYRYRLLNRPDPAPIQRRTAWVVYPPLNLSAMQKAAEPLIGRHDFVSFASGPLEVKTSLCHLTRLEITAVGERLELIVEADRFLHHMVRAVVGTLVEVGLGKRDGDEIPRILEARDRRRAGRNAPPQGLCLMKVIY